MAAISTNWPDLLDSRFAKIHDDRFKQLADFISKIYTVVGPGSTPTKDTYRTSSAGTFGDVPEFTGTVTYDEAYEGYDGTITPKEYATGFQIQRKLYDDGLYGVMDGKPRALATAYQRTRQKHAAQLFNNGFTLDTEWNLFTENLAIFSNSHTTRTGASTATGFDNLVTTAFSAVALAAARILMVDFRGDRAERITVDPSIVLHPIALYDSVYEVTKSVGKPGTSLNDANVHEGQYTGWEWNYLTDSNNWFLIDPVMMKDAVTWYERIPYEFAMVEEMDTILAKWRLYARYGHGHDDWRWGLGAQVS